MEPSLVHGACPLHTNFHSIELLLAWKSVRLHVASEAAASSRNTQLWAEMSSGLMQRVPVKAGWICPSLTSWLINFQSPGFALRPGGLAQKATLMSQRVPPLLRQVFKASLWACSRLPAWLAAKRLLTPTARAAQLFEKLATTMQPSPFFVQKESALRLASLALPASTDHA